MQKSSFLSSMCNLSRYIIAKCSYFVTQMLYDEHVACQKNRVAVLCVYQTVEYTLVTSLMKEKCMEKQWGRGGVVRGCQTRGFKRAITG